MDILFRFTRLFKLHSLTSLWCLCLFRPHFSSSLSLVPSDNQNNIVPNTRRSLGHGMIKDIIYSFQGTTFIPDWNICKNNYTRMANKLFRVLFPAFVSRRVPLVVLQGKRTTIPFYSFSKHCCPCPRPFCQYLTFRMKTKHGQSPPTRRNNKTA